MDDVPDPPPTRERPRLSALGLQIVGFAATNHVLTRVVSGVLPDPEASRIPEDLALFGQAAIADLAEALVLLAVVPGVLEELIFRGPLFGLLLRFAGVRGAIVGSALAFGAVHLDLHLSTIAALLGLQLGCLRHVHGLGIAILAHVTNNAAVLLLRYHDEAGLAWWPPLDTSGATAVASFGVALVLAGIAWAALAQAMRSSAPSSSTPAAGSKEVQTTPEVVE